MKNNKIIVTLISIATLLAIFTLFSLKNIFVTNVNKLMGSVSYPTSNGVKISCNDTTLTTDATTTCTLTGHLDGGIRGVTGKFVSSGGIEIVSVTEDSSMNNQGSGNSIMLTPKDGNAGPADFIAATVTIRGIFEGSGSVEFTGDMEEQVELTNASFQATYVNGTSTSITVSNGGSVTPDPTPSSDNTLSSIKVGQENISLTSLSTTVPFDVNQVSITATTNDPTATYVVSNSQNNSLVTLAEGVNTINIIVTAPNGSTRTYQLTITKESPAQQSSINTLSALTISSGSLVPAFNSSKTDYTVVVENTVDKVTINATRTDDKSSIIEGLGEHNLNVGINFVNVKVRAENGQVKTYSLSITRKKAETIDDTKSKDNSLKSLGVKDGTLMPTFDTTKEQNYIAIVEDDVTSVEIEAQTTDSKATIEYSENGENNIIPFNGTDATKELNIIVTAENGRKRYTSLTIMRRSYYERNQSEIDNNINNNTDKCELLLNSSVYTVDNVKLEINNVNKTHSLDTIKSNLSSDCGTITVNEDKVILSSSTQVKEYKINRVWLPQTGQKVIKYTLAIAVLVLGIIGLIIYKKKMNK